MTAQIIELPIVSLTINADMKIISQSDNWKPIDDPEIAPYYEVNKNGEIREIGHTISFTRLGKTQTRKTKTRIIKQHTNNNGYQLIMLMGKDGKQINRTVHSVVATAWLNKPSTTEKLEIDHINDNRLDNRACNLQWLTISQNRKKRKTPENKYQGKKVMAVKNDIKTEYPSMQQAQYATGVSATTIKGIAAGIITNSSTGYIFYFC